MNYVDPTGHGAQVVGEGTGGGCNAYYGCNRPVMSFGDQLKVVAVMGAVVVVAAGASLVVDAAVDTLFGESTAALAESEAGAGQTIRFDDEQWGNKVGKHARDWGLDASKADDRAWLKDKVVQIVEKSDQVREGTWRGLGPDGSRGAAKFFLKGHDVVVTDMNNNFVTVLKDGITNGSFTRATVVH